MEGADQEAFGLEPVATRVWQGQIWCCVDPWPPSFDDSIVAQAERRLGSLAVLDRYGLDGLVLASRRTYEVAANWKLLIENFMECYHCATIHPELTNTLPEFRTGVGTQNQPGSSAAFADTVEAFTLSGRGGLGLLPGLSADDDRRYYGMTLLPQVFVNLLPDHVVVHRMQPVAVDRSVIVCDWLVDRGRPGAPGYDPQDTIALFDRVNLQDFLACERCQKNMSSRLYADGGVLAATEHHLADFHSYVLGAVGASRASLT
jgi:Rieske 2Fe-2S family protein